MAEQVARFHSVAIFANLIGTALLAVLLSLGVYVNVNKFIVDSTATDGYRAVNVDTTSWNVACTIVGTAVGILATVAFASQDDIITRRELANDRGVVAMFLRPLTVKRGIDQVFRLQLPFERTILVVLTMATALTSATIVALFGIRATTDEIVNPAASYPLAALNSSFFESSRGGGVFAIGSPADTPHIHQLSGFLYKAAYITGLKMQGRYVRSPSMYTPYLPEQGSLGDTIYGELNTGGVGLNASSYLQYSGVPDGFKMPARFEFNKLYASVFGTHVSVSCQNVTSKYTTVDIEADIGGVRLLAVGKPGGPNITLFRDLRVHRPSLIIGSAVTVDSDTSEPTQTLVILGFSIQEVFVLECTYSGREYLADVSIASPVSPLRIDRETVQGPVLGPYVKQQLANITHGLLALGGMGGNLAQGFTNAGYNAYGDNNTDVTIALEKVIEQLGEAYFSLMRQQVERSNLYKGESQSSKDDSEVRLYVTVLRLGGGRYAWLVVLGMLLTGTAVGTVRSCVGRTAVEFEAQNSVMLLRSTLHDPSIQDTTRVSYKGGITVLKEGGRANAQLTEPGALPTAVESRGSQGERAAN